MEAIGLGTLNRRGRSRPWTAKTAARSERLGAKPGEGHGVGSKPPREGQRP